MPGQSRDDGDFFSGRRNPLYYAFSNLKGIVLPTKVERDYKKAQKAEKAKAKELTPVTSTDDDKKPQHECLRQE